MKTETATARPRACKGNLLSCRWWRVTTSTPGNADVGTERRVASSPCRSPDPEVRHKRSPSTHPENADHSSMSPPWLRVVTTEDGFELWSASPEVALDRLTRRPPHRLT